MEELTKDQIRDWLLENGRDRLWLAKACGTSKGTVDQWFAERGFSESAKATIRALMRLDELTAIPSQVLDETKYIEFTTSEFEEIEEARAKVGSPSRPDFYHDAILRYVQELREKGLPPPTDDELDDDASKHLGAAFDAFSKRHQPPSQGRR